MSRGGGGCSKVYPSVVEAGRIGEVIVPARPQNWSRRLYLPLLKNSRAESKSGTASQQGSARQITNANKICPPITTTHFLHINSGMIVHHLGPFTSFFAMTQSQMTLQQDGVSPADEDPCSRFFDLMQVYIQDLPYSPSQREKLGGLMSLTKERWVDIVRQKEKAPETSAGKPSYISDTAKFENPGWDGRSLLGRFCRDLTVASFDASLNAGSDGPSHYRLSGEYLFPAELGPKDHRFKKSVKVVIDVSEHPEVVCINYPSRRILGIRAGSCSQFDSGVFFGDDGKIYLVDNELADADEPSVEEGRKVYESEDMLLWSWRKFTMK
jgi:hypothetical protein